MPFQNIVPSYRNWENTSEIIHAVRSEKLLWSNCTSIELARFDIDGQVIRVIIKKSRLPEIMQSQVEEDYRKIKLHLGNLVPNQSFITEQRGANGLMMITALCAPVTIAYDVFHQENIEFFRKAMKKNPKLKGDLQNFIAGYRGLRNEGFYLDLFGEENLVITREWRLKYIDSFMLNMQDRKSLKEVSEKRFQKLCRFIG